jgi:hypothetical protein
MAEFKLSPHRTDERLTAHARSLWVSSLDASRNDKRAFQHTHLQIHTPEPGAETQLRRLRAYVRLSGSRFLGRYE